PEVIASAPEASVPAMPVEPIVATPPAQEIPLERVHVSAPPVSAAPSVPSHEIDISNEWEEMIEVEPVEAKAEPLDQSDQEAAAHPPVRSAQPTAAHPPVRSAQPAPLPAVQSKRADTEFTTQIADKVQEIRFYITQEMWESAKSAILDLTELAPDAPDVTDLIAAVSAGQSKPTTAKKATPVFIEEPVQSPPPEVAKAKVVQPPPREVPKPKSVEPPPEVAKPKAVEPAKPPEKKKEPVREPVLEPAAFAGHEDVLDIPEPPRAKPAAARAAPKDKSTEDILTDFVLDLEQSEEMADFSPKQRPAPAPVGTAASAMDRRGFTAKTNGDMQDKESANALSDILSELQEETAEAAEPEEDPETHYNLRIAFKEMG